MDDTYKRKLNRMELADLRKERDNLRARHERLRGNNVVSVRVGNLQRVCSAKISALTTAIAVRENGAEKIKRRPLVGDTVVIRGTFKGRGDFESAQTVMNVGATTFQTTNGWSFFCRHDGWISSSYPDDLFAVFS